MRGGDSKNKITTTTERRRGRRERLKKHELQIENRKHSGGPPPR